MKVFTSKAIALVPIAMLFHAAGASAQAVNLGAAGDFAILETGAGAQNATISLAAAPPNGFINGNVGMAASQGNLSVSAGNLPIEGSAYLTTGATSSGLTGNVTGTINTGANLSAAVTAAQQAATTAAGLGTSGGGLAYNTPTTDSINVSGGTLNLTPGVYNLQNFTLGNNEVVNLAAGGNYVFNIKGTMSLNSAKVLAAIGLSDSDVLFNIESSQAVGFSGGLNQECVLDGDILAEDAAVQLTPGYVGGEIISGENINVASGGSVNAPTPLAPVPEPGATGAIQGLCMLALLGAGLIRKQVSRLLKKEV